MYLVEIYSSKRDIYGNCYHYCEISKQGGEFLGRYIVDTPSNVDILLMQYFGGWEEKRQNVFVTHHPNQPIREHKRRMNDLGYIHSKKCLEKVLTGEGESV